MSPYRIYFDANNCDELGRYDLSCKGSREDIVPIEGCLREGMRVIIYMSGELEMEATLEFDPKYDRWAARPVEGTIKYLDGSGPPSN